MKEAWQTWPFVYAQRGAVEEYVQLLLENRQKFLIFAHHTALLDAVEHTCNKKKVKWVGVVGLRYPMHKAAAVILPCLW